MPIGDAQEFKVGEFGWGFCQPHKGPDDAAAFHAGIPWVLHFLHELLLRRYIGHLDTLAVRGILPGVIGAAQPVLFHASEVQRREPMGTKSADEPDGAGRGVEQHQIFAEESNANRPAAGIVQMRRRDYRDPVMAE